MSTHVPTDPDDLAQMYEAMRQVAYRVFGGRPRDTLQPTALVHEVWLALASTEPGKFRSREHFLALGARMMRQILVDHHRSHRAARRGGGMTRVSLEDFAEERAEPSADLVELDELLDELRDLDERKADLVELRVFGGATIEEAAAALDISHGTVSNDWRFVRAWLTSRLGLQESE